jgi:DNA repair/transcription protein MET18/MMS19
MFENNLVGLKKLGKDFVFGFIHAMDGEKDPRNLLLAFQLCKLIVEHLDFTAYTEDLFDVVFCYFPITFKAIPDDPLGLTIDDLKSRLRDVVAATPKFAPFAIPVMIEKLSSDSWSAKVYLSDRRGTHWIQFQLVRVFIVAMHFCHISGRSGTILRML